jgi:hypothetical protein
MAVTFEPSPFEIDDDPEHDDTDDYEFEEDERFIPVPV